MAETRFTPGPWVAQFTGDASWNIIVGDGWMVGEVTGNDKPTDAANAALIAAAPELYAALVMVSSNRHLKNEEPCFCRYLDFTVITDDMPHQAQCLAARAALAKARGEHDG